MSCPYFFPVEMRGGRAVLPLGENWAGECRAIPDRPLQPEESMLRHCNLGYVRLSCPRFPADDGPDAVRFTISSHEGDIVRISYVKERNHLPFAHGFLACSLASGEWNAPSDEMLRRQAQAYLESYLRRKKEL